MIRSYIVVGTAGTPNKLGVMQVGAELHPVCGYCLHVAPFPEQPDTDDLQWVCVRCGHDFKLEGTCDISLHWSAPDNWKRHTIAAWTGYSEDQLVLGFA